MRRIGIQQHEITGMGDAPKTSKEFKKKLLKMEECTGLIKNSDGDNI